MKELLFIYLFVCCSLLVNGQGKPCVTRRIDHTALENAERLLQTQRPEAVSRLIRVYFRICRNNSGGAAAATLADIETEFAQLQQDFAPNNICFANMGVDFIDNDTMNWDIDPNDPDDSAMVAGYAIPGCITIFYHRSLLDVGGSAYYIPNTFFSVSMGNIGLWRTISHEMGHCLGLLHTFETAYGNEYINGTQCATRGDRVCDTPADPWSFEDESCFDNVNCLYTGNCADPGGNSNYAPPYDNIMSYWGVANCNLTFFSGGQYARANSFLDTETGLINAQSPASFVYGPVTISSGYHMQSAINDLTTSGTVTANGTVVLGLQSKQVVLSPGFVAAPSSGWIVIKAANCNY